MSIAFALTKVSIEFEPSKEIDYKAFTKIHKRFLMECQGCFVFEMEKKHELHIVQLEQTQLD